MYKDMFILGKGKGWVGTQGSMLRLRTGPILGEVLSAALVLARI